MRLRRIWPATALVCFVFLPLLAWAQGTRADYERSNGLREKYQNLVVDTAERPNWIQGTSRFWYRKAVKGGNEFVLVDAAAGSKAPVFDHEKLAAALSQAAGQKLEAQRLPFQTITFVNDQKAIQVAVGDTTWEINLADYACKKVPAAAGPGAGGRGRAGGGGMGTPLLLGTAPPAPPEQQPRTSPDGKFEAFIDNYNVWVRPSRPSAPARAAGARGGTGGGQRAPAPAASAAPGADALALSTDGSEGDRYVLNSIVWSPDSSKLAAYRVRPGFHRKVYYIESSPADQVQPKSYSMEYAKPGDTLDIQSPVLFDVRAKKQINISSQLFPNAYDLSRVQWRKDGRAFTFEYNQRGHQVYRVIEVNAGNGQAHTIINEEAATFFCYSGKKYRLDVADGKEIIWMSERDGWNHLYLYDGVTGEVKNQITKGNWVVRGVERVDEDRRQIWFRASGMYPGKDPYFIHYYRINFDGSGLTTFTQGDGNHNVVFSPDNKYYVDTWSRVDAPPVSELRSVEDQKPVVELGRGDASALAQAGWKPAVVFTASGRDGKSEIWGIIIRPSNFDPRKSYPVIENIYAGPQSSFVPKDFIAYHAMEALAELGFVVVQIDGMGTSNRSKAFHDVAWKNLGDAGFADRILWHKAVAAKYPWYDISRVGVYGTSAGGQSAMGAMLFHPEFYKVAVSNSGCHDNRMDKIWWNEQWMGWPLGPEYAAASNVDNAHRLQGKVLLIVGEMDTNVDPASTLQVANALLKANKKFDMLFVPGANHGVGGISPHFLQDYFVHNLLGVAPPDWNTIPMPAPRPGARAGGEEDDD